MALSALGLHVVGRSRKTPFVSESSPSIGPIPYAMSTSERLRIWNMWMSSRAGSPVKISAYLGSGAVSMVNDQACGRTSLGLLGFFDPESYLLRTSQVSLLTNQCDEFLETFPSSGTMRSGTCFQRVSLALPIKGSESGSLPTPMARDQKDLSSKGKTYACQRERHLPSLATVAYLAEVGGLMAEVYEWAMGFEKGWTDPE